MQVFLTMMGLSFFCFHQNGIRLKRITNLGKLCQFGTTSCAEIILIRHDFCPVILKSALSYRSRARLLPRHIFFLILLFIYWIVSYVMLKINLIHNFLRVLVL